MGGKVILSTMMVLAGALTTLITKYQVCHSRSLLITHIFISLAS